MQTTKQPVEQVDVEPESVSVDVSVEQIDANGLQDRLAEIADNFDVTGFKCVKCGLAHEHDTTKHRLSDTFDVDEYESSTMDYNPVCHCGVQEAADSGSELGIDESHAESIAKDAPVPPGTL